MTLAVALLGGLAGALLGALAVVVVSRAQRRAERAIQLAEAIAGLCASVGSLQQRVVAFRAVHERLGPRPFRGPSPAAAWRLVDDSQSLLGNAIEAHTKVVIFATTQDTIATAHAALDLAERAYRLLTQETPPRTDEVDRRWAELSDVTVRLKVQARSAWPLQRRWIFVKPPPLRVEHGSP